MRLIPANLNALKRNNFDTIRLSMAVLVVWSHSFALYYGSEESEPLSILMRGTYNSGNLAVLVFFVISGFLICHSYLHKKSFLHFLNRRVRRIYPGYITATLIGAFIVVPLFSSRMLKDFSIGEISKAVGLNLLLQNYVPPSDVFGRGVVNGSLWSIPYEFWCYIGLAMLGLTTLLSRRAISLTTILITTAVRFWLDLTGRKPGGGFVGLIIGWPYLWFIVLPCFMCGVVAYLYRDALPRSRWLLIAGLVLLVVVANLPIDPLYRKLLTDMLFPPVVAYATFYIAFSENIKLHDAARWGDFSYGTYLYAFPIQLILLASFGKAIIFPVYVALSIGLALMAGAISWHVIERWFMPSRNYRGAQEASAQLRSSRAYL
jgi:peptidoglycan/LPS O-acetylase OafA/YrhL